MSDDFLLGDPNVHRLHARRDVDEIEAEVFKPIDDDFDERVAAAVEEHTRPARHAAQRKGLYDRERRGERYLRRHADPAPEPPPALLPPPLEPEELEAFEWLIGGLILGAEKLCAGGTAKQALVTAGELFDDLMLRIREELAAR